MFNKYFWTASIERAVKAFAGVIAALPIANGIGLTDVAWLDVLAVAGLAGIVNIATSLASAPITGKPSLYNPSGTPKRAADTDNEANQ